MFWLTNQKLLQKIIEWVPNSVHATYQKNWREIQTILRFSITLLKSIVYIEINNEKFYDNQTFIFEVL